MDKRDTTQAEEDRMMRPACIRNAETSISSETLALRDVAFKALNDSTLSDGQADAKINDCNEKLLAAGMPASGLTVSRADYRAAYPTLKV